MRRMIPSSVMDTEGTKAIFGGNVEIDGKLVVNSGLEFDGLKIHQLKFKTSTGDEWKMYDESDVLIATASYNYSSQIAYTAYKKGVFLAWGYGANSNLSSNQTFISFVCNATNPSGEWVGTTEIVGHPGGSITMTNNSFKFGFWIEF